MVSVHHLPRRVITMAATTIPPTSSSVKNVGLERSCAMSAYVVDIVVLVEELGEEVVVDDWVVV